MRNGFINFKAQRGSHNVCKLGGSMMVTDIVALLFLLLPVAVLVEGLYVVQVRVNSYTNPTNRCGTCITSGDFYGCCDTWSSESCTDSRRCDNVFHYCLRPLGTPANNFNCLDTYPQVTSSISNDDEEIDFSQSEVLHLANPFILDGLTSRWTGVQLFVVVIDEDYNETPDDPIDAVTIDLTLSNTNLGVESEVNIFDGIFHLSRIGLQYEVRCAENYNGANCENLDECLLNSVTCGKNGHCQDGDNSYTCVCNPGYTGSNCEVDIDDCDGIDCSRNGRCIDIGGDGRFFCECFEGFTGSLCETDIDDCIGVDCSGNGRCEDGVDTFTCTCNNGFTGEQCETNIDDCAAVTCNENGQCVDGINSFTCTCDSGFTGRLCNTNIDDCAGVDCSGNGQCKDAGINSFTCTCDLGFTGQLCETNINNCAGMNCSGNGRCDNGMDSFTCVCDPEFTGQNCEIDTSSTHTESNDEFITPVDICSSVNCQNNGDCVMNGTDTFLCICDSGFTGQLCEINIDDCASVECNGNGQCIDRVDGFGCICFSGYFGDHCENHPSTNSDSTGATQDTQSGFSTMIIIFVAIGGTILVVSALAMIIGIIACVFARVKTRHGRQDTPSKDDIVWPNENDVSVMEMNRNVGYGVVGVYGSGERPDPTRVGSRRDPIYVDTDSQAMAHYINVL